MERKRRIGEIEAVKMRKIKNKKIWTLRKINIRGREGEERCRVYICVIDSVSTRFEPRFDFLFYFFQKIG
jgi:hypothetical protein